jgi:hypothetical protein
VTRSREDRASVPLHPHVMETVSIVADILLRQRRRQQQRDRGDQSPA